MVKACVIFCTAPALDVAEAIAKHLVENGLAACVSIVPQVRSIYTWQGKVHQDNEVQLIIKTTANAWPEVAAAVRRQHPYDVPELICLDVSAGSAAYLDWISASVKSP